ncbi:hypothetical protein QKT49_gp188 [Acanthamoeba castellanii medusavirus]|uniref:Uncharacterized protein n=1 Tax=Acanthamoeba castellanii medusavirus J1 TaxID=3114988 RepID=A0A3T1CXS4_9VIRU|nr:hypothetical protein QKT49_gp188 [Acanthamoeba castellanii medusavirus]BBI30575.1 hypothetical protein [Acanthamoeba castellanii medusavirus J1]
MQLLSPSLATQYVDNSPAVVAEKIMRHGSAELDSSFTCNDPTDVLHGSGFRVFMARGTRGTQPENLFSECDALVTNDGDGDGREPITFEGARGLPHKYRGLIWNKHTVGRNTLGVVRVLPKHRKRILERIRREHIAAVERRESLLDSFIKPGQGPTPTAIVEELIDEVILARNALEIQAQSFFDKRQRTLTQTGIVSTKFGA